jgi:hypothetical protein
MSHRVLVEPPVANFELPLAFHQLEVNQTGKARKWHKDPIWQLKE